MEYVRFGNTGLKVSRICLGCMSYDREDNVTIVQQVNDIAGVRGLPMAQVALAWMLSKPFVTSPIIGATKPYHLEDAIAALSVRLSIDEIQQLEEAYRPHPVIGFS